MPEISIIIRTKNEERWIRHCLEMIYKQSYQDFEVILVDNQSNDHTVEVAKRFNLAQIVNINEFRPGLAINEGIRVSKGKYIVCLSAHCIPKDQDWLATLHRNFDDDEKIAGVYGRQLPVSFTEALDKRDLLIVFGQDRRVQVKDYFFHNANSMFRKDVWDKYPFDEEVSNIEDRVWGKAVTEAGFHIVYDPDAAVFHHHGLHQGNAPERAKGVVSIIEQVDKDIVHELPESLRPEHAHIAAIVPVKSDEFDEEFQNTLITNTILKLKNSNYVDEIYLLSNNESLAEDLNVNWIDRNDMDNVDQMSIDELMKVSLIKIEENHKYPEALLYVNYEYPFRPDGLFDELILDAQYKGYDAVFPGFIDFGHYWIKENNGDFKQTDYSMKLRQDREPIYRALYGLGCVTSSWVIREGKMVGGKIGILPIMDEKCALRLKETGSKDIYNALLKSQ